MQAEEEVVSPAEAEAAAIAEITAEDAKTE